ncbi:hypothetical protein F511_25684 [Dorcoceras hygrometricum]|uniref:Uncharacterized protein n=1 Tax=Dorcoceras hygrometricum TaxID=472368 RepID=A0A2Z7CN99_9LAMI|nr:hypothetical protein F511_25684 [Dorcoceras hygrometricum]
MGPISNIGPKTPRAARDRPEQNLEVKFSRRNDAGDSSDGGGRRQLSVRCMAARRRAKRGASSQHRAPTVAHIRPTIVQNLAHGRWPRLAFCRATMREAAHSHGTTIVQGCWIVARPSCGDGAQPSADVRGQRVMRCTRLLATAGHHARPACMASRTLLHPRWAAARGGGRPVGITDSACKNHLVVVSVQYGPFNPYIPIRSTTIGKSRVAKDPIAVHTSWRSNSEIASVTSIGYPRMSASGESSTTMHRLLHASGSHPIPPPDDPKTNQYNQDLGLIHSTNGNHLESPNEGSSIDHQVTIYLHAQNITMFPTNET